MGYISQYQRLPSSADDCGPACVAMIADAFGKRHAGETDTALVARCRGLCGGGVGMTDFAQLSAALEALGIASAWVPNAPGPQPQRAVRALLDASTAGPASIALVSGRALGRPYNGHWVVVVGDTGADGPVHVWDPDDQKPSSRAWLQGGDTRYPVGTFAAAAFSAPVGPYGITAHR